MVQSGFWLGTSRTDEGGRVLLHNFSHLERAVDGVTLVLELHTGDYVDRRCSCRAQPFSPGVTVAVSANNPISWLSIVSVAGAAHQGHS